MFLRKIMQLNLLPERIIKEEFKRLSTPWLVPEVDQNIKEFIVYYYKNWIKSTVWPPSNWCVAGMRIRTNNDLEGNVANFTLLQILH